MARTKALQLLFTFDRIGLQEIGLRLFRRQLSIDATLRSWCFGRGGRTRSCHHVL